MKISVIIPTYNHCEDLLKPCLESIIKYTDLSKNDIEIIVVANGCTDNTKSYLMSRGCDSWDPTSEKYCPIKIVWFDEPMGYTKSTIAGIDCSSGEYIILLNNDTVLLPQPVNQWIDMLEAPFHSQPRTGITGPSLALDKVSGSNFIIFFCAMIRRDIYNIVGKIDEVFSPGFAEDIDWCVRASLKGFKSVQVPDPNALRPGGGKLAVGNFPIFHAGEKTFEDQLEEFNEVIKRNMTIISDRYSKILPVGAFYDTDIPTYNQYIDSVPNGGRIAEIGVWKGRSMCSVAKTILKKGIAAVAIDTFEGSESEGKTACDEQAIGIQGVFESNIARFGLTDCVKVVKGDSAESASLFEDGYFNCVFIDADHSYESVKRDIDAWWPKVVEGGILSGHDYRWSEQGVRRAIEEKFGPDKVNNDGGNMWFVNKPGSTKSIKLNLGSGPTSFPGFINVDLYHPHADVKADIGSLPYESSSVDSIVAYHVLEHVSPYKLNDTLREWYRVLKDGGDLSIEMPDILELCKHFQEAPLDGEFGKWRILNCIFGTTQVEHPHLFGWYFDLIKPLFEQAGFKNIVRAETKLHHWGYNFRLECSKHEQKSKVYDCFMFANELDLLELRLNELNDVVDKFVIVEAPVTQTGIDKPLSFSLNKDRFKKWSDKIIHIIVDDIPRGEMNPWVRENFQRDAISRGLVGCNDNDVIIIGDADEIARPEVISNYNTSQGIVCLSTQMSYYYVNCVSKDMWTEPKILPYSILKTMSATNARYAKYIPKIDNAGWHFSYLGGVDKIIEKIKSFAHQEFNNEHYLNRDRLLSLIKSGKDIFERGGYDFVTVPIDSTYPIYLQNNKEKFKDFICELN